MVDGALTCASGDNKTEGGYFTTSVTTPASETVARVTQLHVAEPNITVGSGGTVTAAASLYISSAPSEGTSNYAFWVDEGEVIFDETFICRGNALFGSGDTANAELEVRSASGSSMIRVDSVSATTDTGFEIYKGGSRQWEINNDHTGAASSDALVFKPGGAIKFTFEQSGNLTITGALSKGSGSFNIPHPLPAKSETHRLVHSFVESPETLLLYRGEVTLVDGAAELDMNDIAGMTSGTWDLLCREEIVFATNLTGWSPVRGSVTGCTLTLECQDATSSDTVAFLVTANRHDDHIMDTSWTDEEGRPIVEPELPVIEEDDDEDDED